MSEILSDKGITILDSSMGKNEIRIIKSLKEELGFELINETGKHLFIETEFIDLHICKLVIRQ